MNIFTIFFSQNFSKILSKTHHFKKFLEGACPQIYSLQRRRDRHMAIYMWKILEKSAQLLATYSVSYIRSLAYATAILGTELQHSSIVFRNTSEI